VVAALREATGRQPILVANAPDAATWLPGLACHRDVLPGHGALSGILTAVEAVGTTLCVAWDMPFVPAGLLRELAQLLDGADVAIPESDSRHGVEPLCAGYGPACAPAIRVALSRGDRRAIGFHDAVRVARLGRERVLQYGSPEVLFFNVNGPDDLVRAESLCRVPG
jgi:molybdopterin-guanine dinucleotide biosynthesis protein A